LVPHQPWRSHATITVGRGLCQSTKSGNPVRKHCNAATAGFWFDPAAAITATAKSTARRRNGDSYSDPAEWTSPRWTGRGWYQRAAQALQVSALRQGLPPPGAPDEAYPHSHGGEAARLPVPGLQQEILALRRTDSALENTQQPELEKGQQGPAAASWHDARHAARYDASATRPQDYSLSTAVGHVLAQCVAPAFVQPLPLPTWWHARSQPQYQWQPERC
jgi:hypothetical protein